RRRPCRAEDRGRLVEILAPGRSERIAVRRSDPDRGRAADRERPDRLRDLRGRPADELALFGGKPPLIEQDDGVLLQADDPLRLRPVGLAPGVDGLPQPAQRRVELAAQAPLLPPQPDKLATGLRPGQKRDGGNRALVADTVERGDRGGGNPPARLAARDREK